MNKLFFSVVFLLVPNICFSAIKLDKALYCDTNSTRFFYPLIQKDLINRKPYRVDDSINFFRPTVFNGLTAFGMPVMTVFGWAEDQMIFIRGPGTSPPQIYGVIVNEGIGNVQATLNSVGAIKAKLSRIDRSTTAITCDGI